MLLSASAFGANVPSPLSPVFPSSTLGPYSPPLSPTRSVSPISPQANHPQPVIPWINAKAFPGARSGPPTPISAIDSDLESPHGTSRRLYLPPRKDSMRYTRHIGHLGHAMPQESKSLPGTPPRATHSRSRSPDSPIRVTDSPKHIPHVLVPPRKPVASPVQGPLAAKLSLFPAPPRPILKQTRSNTESSLPVLNSKPSAHPEPRIGPLQRAQTAPILAIETTATTPKPKSRALIPVASSSSIPTITVQTPDSSKRRPSAVDFIAAQDPKTTRLKPAPARAYHVQLISGPSIEGQMAVKWVKKEEKQRRKAQKETLKLAAASHTAPVRQEITVWDDPGIFSWVDSPTLGRSMTAPVVESRGESMEAAIKEMVSPTINRPHPLKTFVSERSRSVDRAPLKAKKEEGVRRKHTRNASDSTQHMGSAVVEELAISSDEGPARGRTRQRRSTMDWGSTIPPAQGPLEIRKSTFIPFKPDLDPEALAALDALRNAGDVHEISVGKEQGNNTIQLLKVPRSKYLEIKPLPPPKPERVYTQGKPAVSRSNSPLAKLANLIK